MASYSKITDYILKQDIGEGNFGKVKLGIHKETGEKFAIKILNKEQIKIKMKNTIFKENEIITKFNHINVIFVFAIIEDAENYYIVMEYCKTGELFDYIVAHQYLSEEESSIFFYQLINGVEYIHSKGIAHRDLKPENLLLTENNILKIIDFGLSHEFDKINFLSTKCGSPSYAAPEIIKGGKYDGFKTDIWCCGIILYAMVCGYLPFDGDNNNSLFKNIVECNPDIPDYLSKECREIIKDILKEDPLERLTIDEIKKTKFYLKGKKLCNLNYNKIEKNILKKRHRIRSYDRGEQNKENMIKIMNNEDKKKNIKNLIEESFKDLEKNKSERSAKVRNTEQKRHMRFINTKTVLNTFRDKINLINKNFNKTIKKFHKNMNLILNTDANVIVNNKINNDPLFNNKIITLTKYNNDYTNNINPVNSTINYIKSASNSKNKNYKNLSIPKKENQTIQWKLIKDNKNSDKYKQRKKYEMIYNNLSHSNDKHAKNEIESNKNNNLKSIHSINITNSINIINNINNTINNYGTLNIFSNKTQFRNNKKSPETIFKNGITNIKKINSSNFNKKTINLKCIKKNIRSVNSSKSAKRENKRNHSKNISKSYKENKKKAKSHTITYNKEKSNKNINTTTKSTNVKKKMQYPSLKVENNLLLKQNNINRIINNINLINRNKQCISLTSKNGKRINIYDKSNSIHSLNKSSKNSDRIGKKIKTTENNKNIERNNKEKKINYPSQFTKEILTEINIRKNKFINSNSISINKRNNKFKSNNSIGDKSRPQSSKSRQNKNIKNQNIYSTNSIKNKIGNKIYNKKRYSENKTKKIISFSKLINNINNNKRNSKSINNIKSDYKKHEKYLNKKKSNNIVKKMDLNRINIRIIKKLNNFNYQNLKNYLCINKKNIYT